MDITATGQPRVCILWRVGCLVLCLRHGIPVWQHIGQSITVLFWTPENKIFWTAFSLWTIIAFSLKFNSKIAEYVTWAAWKNFRVLKIRILSEPRNMFNTFAIITIELIIIFQWNIHKIVESRPIQQMNFKNFHNSKLNVVVFQYVDRVHLYIGSSK